MQSPPTGCFWNSAFRAIGNVLRNNPIVGSILQIAATLACQGAPVCGAAVGAVIPEGHALARAEFNTIRLRLLKIIVRVVEHGCRIRANLPTSMPEKTLFRAVALGLSPSG